MKNLSLYMYMQKRILTIIYIAVGLHRTYICSTFYEWTWCAQCTLSSIPSVPKRCTNSTGQGVSIQFLRPCFLVCWFANTVLSLLSAHALISAHPCFFSIIPQVEPNKRPPLHLRLGLFALVDPPIMPINHWKLDPQAQIFDLYLCV